MPEVEQMKTKVGHKVVSAGKYKNRQKSKHRTNDIKGKQISQAKLRINTRNNNINCAGVSTSKTAQLFDIRQYLNSIQNGVTNRNTHATHRQRCYRNRTKNSQLCKTARQSASKIMNSQLFCSQYTSPKPTNGETAHYVQGKGSKEIVGPQEKQNRVVNHSMTKNRTNNGHIQEEKQNQTEDTVKEEEHGTKIEQQVQKFEMNLDQIKREQQNSYNNQLMMLQKLRLQNKSNEIDLQLQLMQQSERYQRSQEPAKIYLKTYNSFRNSVSNNQSHCPNNFMSLKTFYNPSSPENQNQLGEARGVQQNDKNKPSQLQNLVHLISKSKQKQIQVGKNISNREEVSYKNLKIKAKLQINPSKNYASHIKKARNGNDQITENEIKRLILMVMGLEQLDSRSTKKKIQTILYNSNNLNNYIKPRQTAQGTQTNKDYDNFLKQLQAQYKQENYRQIQEILQHKEEYVSKIQQINRKLELKPCASIQPRDQNGGQIEIYKTMKKKKNRQRLSVHHVQMITKILQNKLKYATKPQQCKNEQNYSNVPQLPSKSTSTSPVGSNKHISAKLQYYYNKAAGNQNVKFGSTLTSLCQEIKKKQNKLNDYFRQINKFNNADKINYPNSSAQHQQSHSVSHPHYSSLIGAHKKKQRLSLFKLTDNLRQIQQIHQDSFLHHNNKQVTPEILQKIYDAGMITGETSRLKLKGSVFNSMPTSPRKNNLNGMQNPKSKIMRAYTTNNNQVPTAFLKTIKCFYNSDKKNITQRQTIKTTDAIFPTKKRYYNSGKDSQQRIHIKTISNIEIISGQKYEDKTQANCDKNQQQLQANNEANLQQIINKKRWGNEERPVLRILNKTQPIGRAHGNMISRKDLRICEKITRIQRERKKIKQNLKISPTNSICEKYISHRADSYPYSYNDYQSQKHCLLQNCNYCQQSGYRQIAQYL